MLKETVIFHCKEETLMKRGGDVDSDLIELQCQYLYRERRTARKR